jgi:NAD(P)H-dependent FMN reductase
MKIVAIAGSSSKNSINKRLSNYASSLFENAKTDLLDLNNYEVEIYSVDKELENGVPSKIIALAQLIDASDLLVLSLAEHNGSFSAAFKNIYDWLSRIPNRKALGSKPLLLMATSPGPRGGLGVLEAAQSRFPRDGSEILTTFSLPSFNAHFKASEISTISYKMELLKKVNELKVNHFKMHYKDDSFSCGIDPTKDDCGDAIEY